MGHLKTHSGEPLSYSLWYDCMSESNSDWLICVPCVELKVGATFHMFITDAMFYFACWLF